MRRAFAIAVLAVSLLSFSALPQEAPTTGSIEGVVVRADTDQSIANAQVTLTPVAEASAPAPAAIVPVITGTDGKFAFKDLKPATYRVAATTDSFIRQANAQRVPNELGRLLFVEAGRSVTDANIRIPQAGTITGRILDDNGQPATGADVQLIRPVYNVQGKTYQAAGRVTVNDRSEYRIFAVPPGHYYLMAGTQRLIDLPGRSLPRFASIYYPGVSGLDEATAIEVKAGNESLIDMRLKRVTQMFHVRGRVIHPAGGPFPQNMRAVLGSSSLSSFAGRPSPNGFDPATGAFDLADVPPGEFVAMIVDQRPPLEMALGASVPVHVTNGDINGLVLTLAAGVAVQGKLIVEGVPLSAVPKLDQLRFFIQVPKQSGLGVPTASAIDAGGRFQVSGLRDWEYWAWINWSSPGFYVHSIKYGGKEILGTTFKFSSEEPGSFEVVLKPATQTVSGKVTDAQSQPVPGIAVVFVPAQRERQDLFRSTNTDQTGKFNLTNLAPGEYKVFSGEVVANNAFRDPDFLKQYEELGKSINVTEFGNLNVEVRLIPAQ